MRIDEQNLREVTQASVRSSIGVVPQDTVMFNATVGYNIGYGRHGATQDEIAAASKMAAIDGFIGNLEHGYDTVVGERGLKLSGGEKQRVAIARAILKQPSIFLFDEATSALDNESEKLVQAALDGLMSGFRKRTTVVIAHRLSTIRNADKICILENDGAGARVVEEGTHDELMRAGGRLSLASTRSRRPSWCL